MQYDAILRQLSQIDLADHAMRIRPGHACTVEMPRPTSMEDMNAGLFLKHIPVDFDDGVRWFARVRLNGFEQPTYEVGKGMMDSEVATMRFMGAKGLKVPNAWPVEQDLGDLNVGFVERLEGEPGYAPEDMSLDEYSTTLEDFAKFQIALSQHPLSGVGPLMDEDGTVGPLVCRKSASAQAPHFPGPFKTVAEKFLALIDVTLKQVRDGDIPLDPVWTYLSLMMVRHLIGKDEELNRVHKQTFIKHGDENGSHLFINEDGSITGIIDWDWAYVTSKDEAFSAPYTFMDRESFLEGNDEPSPKEKALIEAYDKLGRPDLGGCVRRGKKYQRLNDVTRTGLGVYEVFKTLVEKHLNGEEVPGNEREFVEKYFPLHKDDEILKEIIAKRPEEGWEEEDIWGYNVKEMAEKYGMISQG